MPEPEADNASTAVPPSRPRLLPALRWARWALVFLLAFTLLRGGLWAMTFPAFFGGDEDYHFLYIEHLTTQHALPDPDKDLYPREYPALVTAMHYDDYCCGPRPDFSAQPDPKYSVKVSEHFPKSYREPFERGRGVGVVHPPLYHVAGWAVNRSLGDASVFTRYTAIRWLSSVIGVLAVYAAWLLAAQVFTRESLRLLVAFLVAVQPIIALGSGITNHDILLVAGFTLSCAFMLFLLRTPPRARQGAWLGGAMLIALLTKGTALALLPLAAAVYAAQALVYRDRWRQAARSAGLALLVVGLGAGWWYVRSWFEYGSITGATTGDVQAGGVHAPATLDNLWTWARTWTGYTYRTYWFHHIWNEAPKGAIFYYVPVYVGVLGMLGVGLAAIRTRRELLAPDRPLLRQMVLLVAAALSLYLSIMWVDIKHMIDGIGFSMVGGRYLVPAYAGVATLLVAGLRELLRDRVQPVAMCGLGVLAGWFCWSVYERNYVHRYYGDDHASWSTLLRNMSFDRPEFVTATSLRVAFALMVASLAAAAIAVAVGHLPPGARERLRVRRPALRRRVPAPSR
ncbi:MAG TPA: hypothetical protein VF520_00440 [Thermoleophilaceae bacterium]|jgi:hypothetical protein